ncbi:hypothetical protein XA68_15263 [Ophiocordyceps unilateralis]|uniref:Zn(2)-C6 fungal-type domain-containing protein n=1 Tax=Ophiocordyceps unilateralis TaxID=268505 RepID=A0A2A9PKM5_OPHUN|nr:hypothetical protein XA68_15263 [Ophiocordyceps unilateralis]
MLDSGDYPVFAPEPSRGGAESLVPADGRQRDAGGGQTVCVVAVHNEESVSPVDGCWKTTPFFFHPSTTGRRPPLVGAMDMRHFSASVLPFAGPEFDYSSLLQPDDGAVPLPTPAGPASESPDRPTPSSPDAVVRRQPAQRQRLERRGHTKSRRGCYNCKRRRIKCQETRPACGHCVKTGLECEYPSLPRIIHQPQHQIPLFSLQDMRLFQHFLTQCYPVHPLKQDEIWTHEIPCIAHNHDFLMHAVLGFAASELSHTEESSDLLTAAMNHRVKAIRAIKKRLTEGSGVDMTYEEANALVATCFALTFQSVSLDDGLPEYMTFIRGILIIGMQMMLKGITPLFDSLFEDRQDELMAAPILGFPLIPSGWADAAAVAISALRPLCVDAVEVAYHRQLTAIAQKLQISSFDAYQANAREYAWWMMLPHATFQQLINLNRQTTILLHTHWIALSQIMALITEREHEARERRTRRDRGMDPGFIRWLRYLNTRVDLEHQAYNQWPVWVDEQLNRDVTLVAFLGNRR